jgi:transmembrane sensor
MEKTNFDQLLQRYLTGKVSEEEKVKLEAWLDVMKTEDTTNLDLSKEDEEKLFQKITGKIQSKESPFIQPHKAKPTKNWVLQIAASIALLLSVSYLLWRISTNVEVDKKILNDGTLVWLHDKSQLTYYEKPNDGVRYAALTGEALFEVAKDPNRPFVITCGDINIKVLGTSFSLKTWSDSLELTVLTGRVNLSSMNDKTGVTIEPNQKVVYTRKGIWRKIPMKNSDVSTITAHTEYNMQFTNTTLEEIAKKIETKFNVSVNMTDEQASKCRITADFTDHSLASTLQMISEVLHVTYSKNDTVITIDGKGCN